MLPDMPGVEERSGGGLGCGAGDRQRVPESSAPLWKRRCWRLLAMAGLAVSVFAVGSTGLGAVADEGGRALALAPALSTPMGAPAGSIAPTIGAANTAVLPDGRLATPAGRSIVTAAYSNNLIISRAGGRIYTSSQAVSNAPHR